MVSDTSAAKRPIAVRSGSAVAVTLALGLAITLLITIAGWSPAYQNRGLHLAKETAAALVLLLVAAVLAGRVSRNGSLLDLLALAGVLMLATKNLVFSVLTGILAETSGALTTWRTTGAGMLGAALLAVAALAPRKVVRDRRKAILVTAICSLAAFVLLSAITAILQFPGAFTDQPDSGSELRQLSQHPALVVADVAAAVLFLVAGAVFARRAERESDELHQWLAIGATLAAVGYLNYALSPSSYTDFLYAGDLFRIAAVIALGIGTVRELSRYYAVYAPATVLDERRRVARDVQDGVAQELAFVASRLPRLTIQDKDQETIAQINAAVRRALDTSRRAISTLSRSLDEPLYLALANTAKDVVGPAATRLKLDLQQDVVVPAAWEQALQEILRDAVTNAIEHGRAHTVTVRLRDTDGIRLCVADDGNGFDPLQPCTESSFGLIRMRERTESLGGEFRLSSKPGGGTAVEVVLP